MKVRDLLNTLLQMPPEMLDLDLVMPQALPTPAGSLDLSAALDKAARTPSKVASDHTPEVAEFLTYMDGLLEEEKLAYAADTLQGIRDSVDQWGRVTDNQRKAAQNIAATRDRPRGNGGNRRYEGFGGRGRR